MACACVSKKKLNASNVMSRLACVTYGTTFSSYLNFISFPFLQFLMDLRNNSDSVTLNTCLHMWILIKVFWGKNFSHFLNFLVVHFRANYPYTQAWTELYDIIWADLYDNCTNYIITLLRLGLHNAYNIV